MLSVRWSVLSPCLLIAVGVTVSVIWIPTCVLWLWIDNVSIFLHLYVGTCQAELRLLTDYAEKRTKLFPELLKGRRNLDGDGRMLK
jgi:hypothetical protein